MKLGGNVVRSLWNKTYTVYNVEDNQLIVNAAPLYHAIVDHSPTTACLQMFYSLITFFTVVSKLVSQLLNKHTN